MTDSSSNGSGAAAKFKDGAIVFAVPAGIRAKTHDELIALAKTLGLPEGVVPEYAGDREAVNRAVSDMQRVVWRDGYLIRPIVKRIKAEAVWGIIKEVKDETTRVLSHAQEDKVRWVIAEEEEFITAAGKKEKRVVREALIQGDHPIASKIRTQYETLVGKIRTEDWTLKVSEFLGDIGCFRMKRAVFYVPQPVLGKVQSYAKLLVDVGIDLLICEVEPQQVQVVQRRAQETLMETLEGLSQQIEKFDGLTQREGTYKAKLDEFKMLQSKIALYKDSLGIGVDKADALLLSLTNKVKKFLGMKQEGATEKKEKAPPPPVTAAPVPQALPSDTIKTGPVMVPEPAALPAAPGPEAPEATLFFGADSLMLESFSAEQAIFTSDEESLKVRLQPLRSAGILGQRIPMGLGGMMVEENGCVKITIYNPRAGVAQALVPLGMRLTLKE